MTIDKDANFVTRSICLWRGLSDWLGSRICNTKLAYNATWMSISQAGCLLIQAAYFTIIARCLATQSYGAFVATSAFAFSIYPFIGFGWSDLLIKHVSRDRSAFRVYWGNLLFLVVCSGITSASLVIVLARFVLPKSISLPIIVPVTIAELLFSRLSDCVPTAFQSIERLDLAALPRIAAALARFIGIVVLASLVHHPSAAQWSFVYLLSTASVSVPAVFWASRRIGKPALCLTLVRNQSLQGACFAVSGSAQIIHDYIDQTMLARLAALDATAIYAIAARLVEIAFIPIRSLLNAAYPGFFRAGQSGIRGSVAYMSKLLPKSIGYAVCASLGLYFCAPLLPLLFGPQYSRSVAALRILSLLPVLRTLYYFLADAITSTGHQGVRTCVQVVVATSNITLNLWALPKFSWRGAAWTSVVSDGLLALSMFLLVSYYSRLSRKQVANSADPFVTISTSQFSHVTE